MDPFQLKSALPASKSRASGAEPSIGGDSFSSGTSASFTSVSSFTSGSSISLSSFTSVSSTSCDSDSSTLRSVVSPASRNEACHSTTTSVPVTSPQTTSELCSDVASDTGSLASQSSPQTSCQSSKSNLSSRSPICRICHEGEGASELISPCWCTGSIGAVHRACLERWLTLASCDKCELCGYAFPVTRSPKPFWKFLLRCNSPGIRRALLVDGICLLVLTPLAAASIYLCMMGAFYYANQDLNSTETFLDQLLILANVTYQAEKIVSLGSEEATETPRRRRHKVQEENVEKEPMWKVLGLVLLALALLAIYSAWASIVYGYHSRVWRQWRVIHQDLALVDTGRRPNTLCQDFRSSFSVVSLQGFGDLPSLPPNAADILLVGGAGEDAVTPSGGLLDCGSSTEDLVEIQFADQESAAREA